MSHFGVNCDEGDTLLSSFMDPLFTLVQCCYQLTWHNRQDTIYHNKSLLFIPRELSGQKGSQTEASVSDQLHLTYFSSSIVSSQHIFPASPNRRQVIFAQPVCWCNDEGDTFLSDQDSNLGGRFIDWQVATETFHDPGSVLVQIFFMLNQKKLNHAVFWADLFQFCSWRERQYNNKLYQRLH